MFTRCRARLVVIGLGLMATFVLCSPFAYGSDLLVSDWQSLGMRTEGLAKLTDSELDQMRGRFMGFFLSVMWTGVFDRLGNGWSNFEVTGGVGQNTESANVTVTSSGTTGSTSVSVPSPDVNPPVTSTNSGEPLAVTTAVIGGLNGAQGVFQINQIPGSGVWASNDLVINLTIVNVVGSQNLSNLLNLLNF